jgi:hypothetical protein
MFEKIKDLLSSIRFWTITFAAVFAVLNIYYPGNPVLEIARNWLIAVFGAGTLDSVALKLKRGDVPPRD